MSARRQSGFTLFELVVAISIGSIIVLFAAMFMSAPIDAYDAQSRRQTLVGDVNAAWPRMQRDLAEALPNSVRRRPNGNYVALEFMPVLGVSRYTGTAGIIKGQPADRIGAPLSAYLSVNPTGNLYALNVSITNAPRSLTWTTTDVVNGKGTLTVAPTAPNFTAGHSSRRRIYLVDSPVTYLCDLTQGTLRRYSRYTVASNHALRDAPNEFGSALGNELIARGLTACSFDVFGGGAAPQTVSVRLTAARANETVALLHQSRPEYLP
jgi:MSHA biogenesis protein MshO